jgi:hypothetical protein
VRWGIFARSCRVVRVVFPSQQLCYPSAAAVWSFPPPVMWDSSVLNAAFWFRRSALPSTTCPALGGGLLPSLALSLSCVYLLRVQGWEFSSLPLLYFLQGRFSVSFTTLCSLCVLLQFALCFCLFQFCLLGVGSFCPGTALVYLPGGWVGLSHVVCGVHLFVLPINTQAGLEPAVEVGRNGTNFSQYCAV